MIQRIGLMGLALALVFAAVPVLAEDAKDDVTLEGQFVWVRDDGDRDGPLKAILTPSGEGEWSVAFHFDWEDEPHVYTGTCTGSLDGELSGDIVSDGEREMKFRFSGKFEDGTFSGTHGFVDDDGTLKDAGTLTLSKG